ncbi:MAG: ABC transporter ATP-binding protein, partial [Candidatus Hodarchaeota archaeon]
MPTDWTIDLLGISKKYQDKIALKNVTIKWEKGVLGLIGPNGAGKSTLIKILCTVLRPDKGHARIFGKDVVSESLEVRRRIGVLFENPVFHPNLKVISSLCWVGELRGFSHEIVKRHVFELLEYFELEKMFNHNIKELSAGMRQKYGLIFATLGTPPLIILDEPTSNLDPDSRQLYKKYVNRLVKENNCSFLISSHVLGELDSLCNGFVFLFKGVVTESGKREDLKLKISVHRFK